MVMVDRKSTTSAASSSLHLGGGVPVGGPVHLVLHGLEEQRRSLGGRVVVDAGGVDVENLLVEHPLGRADVADAGEQFVKIVGAERSSFLETLVVHREPLDQELGETRGGPLTKRGATGRPDAVADRENGVEGVVLDVAGNVANPFALNYSETPNSCPCVQFSIFVNPSQMLIYGRDCHAVKLGDELLREPDCVALQADLKLRCAVGVDEELPLWRGKVGVVRHVPI